MEAKGDQPRMAVVNNIGSRKEVDEVVRTALTAGGEMTKTPSETFYGRRVCFYFRNPEGHVWEIAHNPRFMLGADGALTLPNFGRAD
jgi:uncharacterized glyoxalase superfamily protein PhnB